jgi:hypothetical protein
MRTPRIASIALVLGAVFLSSCSKEGSAPTAPSTRSLLVGTWNYGRWNGDMFDSAHFVFQDGGKFSGQAVFHLRGSYYQIVYEFGSWSTRADSLTFRYDTLYESRDTGKTFRPFSGNVDSAVSLYSVDASHLVLTKTDTSGTSVLEFVRE